MALWYHLSLMQEVVSSRLTLLQRLCHWIHCIQWKSFRKNSIETHCSLYEKQWVDKSNQPFYMHRGLTCIIKQQRYNCLRKEEESCLRVKDSVADPRGGWQNTILLKFPQNSMKSRKFGCRGSQGSANERSCISNSTSIGEPWSQIVCRLQKKKKRF